VSPELRDHIAAFVVLVCDAKQNPDHVHKLLQAIADQAHCEGYMAGLERSEALMHKHLGRMVAI